MILVGVILKGDNSGDGGGMIYLFWSTPRISCGGTIRVRLELR